MTTASEIIGFAYREANFNAVSATPTADELSEGLTLLQSIVSALHGLVVGVKIQPWYVPNPQKTTATAANYPAAPGDSGLPFNQSETTPPANVRLMMKNTDDMTVYFQYQPQDGALMEYVDVGHTGNILIDGNGQMIGLTGLNEQVEIDAAPGGRNAPRRWVYRADYGAWLEITNLTLAGDMPFPLAFDDYFVTELAIRLTPRFGSDPRAATLQRNQRMTLYISGQWLQTKEVLNTNLGVPSSQNYDWNANRGDFNAGRF